MLGFIREQLLIACYQENIFIREAAVYRLYALQAAFSDKLVDIIGAI